MINENKIVRSPRKGKEKKLDMNLVAGGVCKPWNHTLKKDDSLCVI